MRKDKVKEANAYFYWINAFQKFGWLYWIIVPLAGWAFDIEWSWAGGALFIVFWFLMLNISRAELYRLDCEYNGDDIQWLQDRLSTVDRSWKTEYVSGAVWHGESGSTDSNRPNTPPPDEIVGLCPKCNRSIKRRELLDGFNGGH